MVYLTQKNVSQELASMLADRIGSNWSSCNVQLGEKKIIYTQNGEGWSFPEYDILPFIPIDAQILDAKYGFRKEVKKYRNALLTKLLCDALDSIRE